MPFTLPGRLTARTLNVSQPSVSKVLKHAEDQLGFSLFNRIKGRHLPTQRGNDLFQKIEPIFHKLNELKRFTTELAQAKTGRLRFAITPAFSQEIAPRALSEYAKAHSDVTIEVETLHAHQISKAILDKESDVGLVFDAPRTPGLTSQTLGNVAFVCIAPEDVQLPQANPLPLAALTSFPLITLNEKSVLGQTLKSALEEAVGPAPDSRIIVETYHIAKRLVQEGLGIAVIDSISAYSNEVNGLQYRRILPHIPIKIDLVTRIDEPQPAFWHLFIEKLEEVIIEFQKAILFSEKPPS